MCRARKDESRTNLNIEWTSASGKKIGRWARGKSLEDDEEPGRVRISAPHSMRKVSDMGQAETKDRLNQVA